MKQTREILIRLIRAGRRDLARAAARIRRANSNIGTVRVGLSWYSVDGVRRVAKVDDSRRLAYLKTEQRRYTVLLPVSEVFEQIESDTKRLARRQQARNVSLDS